MQPPPHFTRQPHQPCQRRAARARASRPGTIVLTLVAAGSTALCADMAQAQYKCLAASGAVTYQQAACPITQTQQLLKARTASAAASAPARAASAAPIASAEPKTVPSNVPPVGREREAMELNQGLANIEAHFERLKRVREELDAAHRVASK